LSTSRWKKYYNKHPWYKFLKWARRRCNDSKTLSWSWYGGKGVKCLLTIDDVKKLWVRDDADNLLRPSLDRIDSDGNYVFENCRFIELTENVSGQMILREIERQIRR